MPKKIIKNKKGFIRPVHLEAVIVFVAYFILSNLIFLGAIAHPNIFVSFFVPLSYGTLSAFAFLYLFGHKDFFHFIKALEKEEREKEKKYLDKFDRYGRTVACILISQVAGPVFLALTIRFLFPKSENRYLVAFVSTLVSTIIAVGFAKGLFNFIF